MESWNEALREILLTLLSISLLRVSIFLQIFAVGLAYTWSDAAWVFRHPRTLAKSVLITNVVMPFTAITLIKAFSLRPGVGMALAMLSVTPMLLLPRDHVATAALKEYATRFIIPQAVLATLAIPIMVSLVNWSLAARANVDGRALARFVGETTIFPLILGFFTSFLFPNLRRWFPFLVMMGALSLLAGMLSLLPLARGAFVVLVASGTLWAVLGFTIAGLIAGQFINRSSKEHRGSFQTSLTGHPGLALAIAALNFPSESKLVCGAILFYVAVEAILTIIDVFRRRTVFRHPSDERAASVAAS